MTTKLKIAFIFLISLLPFFAYSEGQDWMMNVDNGIYFLKLLIIYLMVALVTYYGAQKTLKRKMKIIFFLIAAISITIIHWQTTKQKPLNGPIEKYLNSKDIDTTRPR